MSELADELAHHARPEHMKELAAGKVGEWKERAKEAVMHRTQEVKDKVDTPRGWSLLGALIGAGVGGILMKKAFAMREERPIGVHGGTPAAGVSGDISAMGGDMPIGTITHTDVNLKERASDVVQTVKGRTSDWFDRAVENQPLMLALGTMALGVLASLIIPVSFRERQLIEPAKRKAQEGLASMGMGSSGTGSSYQGDIGAMRSSTLGAMDRSEDLMGAERPGLDGSGSRIPPPPPLDDVSTKIH
ncbi:hypothetical protein [Hyalangium minutum]|uniref:DUF3618 domain-containing protein n=1 Tax=Hyalangium minutum TaxID=394096 RepID=A0A085W2N6_9BACT|nr:hypothetical protein [Hyalangium minutum]KFE61949.1 hypothetical protein DB31_4392 [Hyalangium minutum]